MSRIMNDATYSTFATWTMESILRLQPRWGGNVIVSHKTARNLRLPISRLSEELFCLREFHYIPRSPILSQCLSHSGNGERERGLPVCGRGW